MLDETGPDPQPRPFDVGGELAEKKARNRVRWLPGPDRARQNRRHNRGRSEAIVTDDAPCLVNDEHRGKTLLLV